MYLKKSSLEIFITKKFLKTGRFYYVTIENGLGQTLFLNKKDKFVISMRKSISFESYKKALDKLKEIKKKDCDFFHQTVYC